ncbi:MAG: hypothetical protein HRT90_09585, partial [Candidatus Margulisbacteria bacterium]|nr:hypothetical protein [Candidatus Margulisiibacteriota bacterium]
NTNNNHIEKIDTTGNEKFAVKLEILTGISIPVILRNGETEAKVTITDTQVSKKDNEKSLTFMLNRSGNASALGTVWVSFKPSNQSKNYPIGLLRNATVLYPQTRRHIEIPIQWPDSLSGNTSGTYHIEYRSPENEGNHLITQFKIPKMT